MAEGYSWFQLGVAFVGSSGLVGGLWTAFVFFSGKLEARRKRLVEERAKEISSTADLRRIDIDTGAQGTKLLWDIIAEQKAEIKDLRAELEAAEKAERLDRVSVMTIYECVRQIKNEMDSLNLMILSDHETNVFARRWGNIKTIMISLEATLAGQKLDLEARDDDRTI